MTTSTKPWDAIVVGLGAMGAATVYQLAKRGARVLGLDRLHPPHDLGSSHGESRITRLALGEGAAYLPFARRSHAIWRELEAATGSTLFREVGCLVYSSAEGRQAAHGAADFLQTTIDVARENHLPHEVLSAAELARRFPQFRLAGDETGCLEPGAGLVHPEACLEAQLSEARRLGAEIHTGETARGWRADGQGARVETDRGEYLAGRLVLTAGPWLPELWPGLPAKVCRQVLYWFETAGPAEEFGSDRMPVFIRVPDRRAAMFYGFPAIDGAGGGLKIAGEQFEQTCRADTVDRRVTEAEIAAMHALAAQHLRIARRLVKAAVCAYTVTPDFHFLLDRHPKAGNVWVASACSGHGFKHSAAVGEALAQQVTEGRCDYDLAPFRWGREALHQAAGSSP